MSELTASRVLPSLPARDSRRRTDHDNRRNYDDFNEFFWKPECLK